MAVDTESVLSMPKVKRFSNCLELGKQSTYLRIKLLSKLLCIPPLTKCSSDIWENLLPSSGEMTVRGTCLVLETYNRRLKILTQLLHSMA